MSPEPETESTGTMRFFGDPKDWDAPCSEGKPFEEPPVGAECGYGCGVPIAATDTGTLIPYWDGTTAEWKAWHRACFQRSVGVPERYIRLTDKTKVVVVGHQVPVLPDAAERVAAILSKLLGLELVDGRVLRVKHTPTHYVDLVQTTYGWQLGLVPEDFPGELPNGWFCYTGRHAFAVAYTEARAWPEGDDGRHVPARWYRNTRTDERHREYLHNDSPDLIAELGERSKAWQ